MSDVRVVRGRYIDADKFITTIDSSGELDAYSAITVCDLIESELPADVVEVVRCKDCEHWTNDDCPFSWGKVEDAFCSYGERREDGI